MPIKKTPQNKVFMNHVVINGEQKPIKPVMRPVIIPDNRIRKNINIKYK